MPDYNHLLTHPQIGPALSATTWVGLPVVGATHSFAIRVSRKSDPVNNATVTIRIYDSTGAQVYPASGAMTIPADPTIPGTYSYTPASTGIFTQAGSLYTASWSVTVPAAGSDPQLVLPVIQKLIAQEP
jgi:hypothetical protein